MTNTPPTSQTSMMIRRPVADVYAASIDPSVTTRFWFTNSTWSGYKGRERVEWTFTDRSVDTTNVTIEDSGFTGDPNEATEQAVNATEGFAYTRAGAKAWLVHGIELNLVRDKFPDREST